MEQFVTWLAASDGVFQDPVVDAGAGNYAARDFKAHLKRRRCSPRRITGAPALDSFYRFLAWVPHARPGSAA